MAAGLFPFLILFCCRSLVLTYAQSISTSITVPPLQWINITNLLSGSTSPPALKDATIGYDETSRSLIVFGGESEAGVAQSTTYLLNLDTLTWSIPNPPDSLDSTPAARSAAVGGGDFAASNRHGFVVIGGKGSSGQALSDVWEFDFTNQFWAQVQISGGGPPARWGAVGGIDIRTAPIQDPIIAGPNNTLYLVGGADDSEVFSLSDVWRLNISGALSSNLVNDTSGSWDRVSSGNLPSRTGAGGTVLHQQVIAVGGCGSSSGNESCIKQDSYILNLADDTELSPAGCPVPRSNPVVVTNTNTFSTSFSSQIFLLLGTFDDSLWSDGGNLAKGEVAVLDTNTLTWSRVLPSGDPGDNGIETFPSPRKGAAALAYSSALVGTSRNDAADIIVFGGQDDTGDYLSEVWILRTYNGDVTSSSSQWSGYGTGNLETGVDASGVHVSVQILSECAKALSSSSSATSTTSSQTPTSSSTSPGSPNDGTVPSVPLYDTSFYHKLLAPLSLAIFLPGLVLFRLFAPIYSNVPRTESALRWIYLSGLIVLISYGMGVAALALSFATITSHNFVSKRSTSDSVLKTGHGKVGLAFFIGLYAVVPTLLLLLTSAFTRGGSVSEESELQKRSTELTEKLAAPDEASSRDPIVTDYPEPSRSTTPRMRTPSFGTSVGMMRPSGEDPLVSDSESLNSGGPQRTFEVLSRPPRHQKNSSNWLSPTTIEPQQAQRTLAEIDWLQRRRSLNAVDELDYAITQRIRAQQGPSDHNVAQSHLPLTMFRPWFEIFTRFLLHFFFLGLCIICLVALNARAPASTFGVFLAWVVLAYIFIIYLSWNGRPPLSTLTIIFLRLRTANSHPELNSESRQLSSDGPYLHQPSHRVAPDRQDAMSHGHARSAEDEDEDEDEDTRQQRMEREMERRDVSIVTVPKRKLWITNPS